MRQATSDVKLFYACLNQVNLAPALDIGLGPLAGFGAEMPIYYDHDCSVVMTQGSSVENSFTETIGISKSKLVSSLFPVLHSI